MDHNRKCKNLPAAMTRRRVQRACAVVGFLLALTTPAAHGQNLNWEGQTGAFVTPFAYVTDSPARGIGLPAVSFHYLNGGQVLGGFYEVSKTVGFLKKRAESGFRPAGVQGPTVPGLESFEGGFNIFHAKTNLLRENAGKRSESPRFP